MVNIVRVLIYEINRTIRRKGFLFATFGLPLLLFAFTFVWRAFTPTPEQMVQEITTLTASFDGLERVGLVDLSGEFAGVDVESLTSYPDEAAALAALERDEIDAVYVLPADYAETGLAREIIPRMAMDDITGGPLVALAAAALAEQVDEARIERLQEPAAITTVDLNRVDADGNPVTSDLTENEREDAGFALVYLFAMLFILTAFTGSGYLMQSVIEEKENRLVEVLITSVRPSQLLAGKVLAGGIMSLFQIGMWAVIALLLLRLQGDFLSQMIPFLGSFAVPAAPLPVIAAYFLIGFFMFAALFGMVGAISNSAQEGPQWTVVFVLPAMIPLWAAPAILAEPNGSLATLLSLIPLTAPIGMTARLVLTQVPVIEIAASLAILFAFTVFLYWLAGRFFRVQILLSGKLPRLRDLPRLIFSS
jgi:ABC-2 type transport system permease protein